MKKVGRFTTSDIYLHCRFQQWPIRDLILFFYSLLFDLILVLFSFLIVK